MIKAIAYVAIVGLLLVRAYQVDAFGLEWLLRLMLVYSLSREVMGLLGRMRFTELAKSEKVIVAVATVSMGLPLLSPRLGIILTLLLFLIYRVMLKLVGFGLHPRASRQRSQPVTSRINLTGIALPRGVHPFRLFWTHQVRQRLVHWTNWVQAMIHHRQTLTPVRPTEPEQAPSVGRVTDSPFSYPAVVKAEHKGCPECGQPTVKKSSVPCPRCGHYDDGQAIQKGQRTPLSYSFTLHLN